jgi:hypothetical protein
VPDLSLTPISGNPQVNARLVQVQATVNTILARMRAAGTILP